MCRRIRQLEFCEKRRAAILVIIFLLLVVITTSCYYYYTKNRLKNKYVLGAI